MFPCVWLFDYLRMCIFTDTRTFMYKLVRTAANFASVLDDGWWLECRCYTCTYTLFDIYKYIYIWQHDLLFSIMSYYHMLVQWLTCQHNKSVYLSNHLLINLSNDLFAVASTQDGVVKVWDGELQCQVGFLWLYGLNMGKIHLFYGKYGEEKRKTCGNWILAYYEIFLLLLSEWVCQV